MPKLFLSPSTQEYNLYVNGGTEEEYMNLVADAMEPYLISSGITYTRNTPDMTAASSIAMANEGDYELYIALHSNASGTDYGSTRGSIAFYYPTSAYGKRFAELIAKNAKRIYPMPDLVRAEATTNIGEVRRSRAPASLWEIAYHDNEDDATWIKNNIPNIAWAAALSVAEYFGVPLAEPQEPWQGTVATSYGNLNIRYRPAISSKVIGSAPKGAHLTVLGETGDWYVVDYNGTIGYANSQYIVR